MATKQTKPDSGQASPAKILQEQSETPMLPDEDILSVTLRLDNSFEYHLDLARSIIDGILDPDVADTFMKVPCAVKNTTRFLHTSRIRELDVKGL